jgi:4-diphosphocytidyl-2-C-methyl-D-erythritol kinase
VGALDGVAGAVAEIGGGPVVRDFASDADRTPVLLLPAKINTFLSVGPPDRRGWHPLRTVFQAVGLYDELHVEPGRSGVTFEGEDVPEENTVTKALRLLGEIADLPPMGLRIVKRIPSCAGLGGASTDAAGVLRLARRLVPGLPEAEVKGIAAAVGADVPFFLVGGRAKAEGYGERLTPLPDSPEEWVVIARPDVGCPTPAAYKALDALGDRPFLDFEDRLYNDFERVAPCECLDLIERLNWLGGRAGLSGSGSAVFGLFPSRDAAEIAAGRLSAPFVAVAPTLRRGEGQHAERRSRTL